jgi:hypothetical protein
MKQIMAHFKRSGQPQFQKNDQRSVADIRDRQALRGFRGQRDLKLSRNCRRETRVKVQTPSTKLLC